MSWPQLISEKSEAWDLTEKLFSLLDDMRQ